jgi:hypothetical protein
VDCVAVMRRAISESEEVSETLFLSELVMVQRIWQNALSVTLNDR